MASVKYRSSFFLLMLEAILTVVLCKSLRIYFLQLQYPNSSRIISQKLTQFVWLEIIVSIILLFRVH